jgi:hypothetical protein
MLTELIERPIGTRNIAGTPCPEMLTIERHDPQAYLAKSVCVMTGTVELHIVRPIGATA